MTNAADIVRRIRKGGQDINFVELEILSELTQEERLEFSDLSGKYPTLNIWATTWMYVTELDKWVEVGRYNAFNDSLSWYPDFVTIDDGYLLDVENAQLYKAV